jgi:hypothetical protein
MTFRVGQKVEFLGFKYRSLSRWLKRALFPYPGDLPVKGHVYEIANITPEGCIELCGINSPGNRYWNVGFAPWRFRPIIERKAETDISFAHEILRKISRKETVRA